MIEQNIISLAQYDTTSSSSLSNELESDWSDAMKGEISYYINQQKGQSGGKVAESPGSHGINQTVIAKIGRKFNADYIVRGRILEFKTRQEHSWAPWKHGILPFISGTTNQVAFGFAESDKYDNISMMAAGGAWGAIIGHNVGGHGTPRMETPFLVLLVMPQAIPSYGALLDLVSAMCPSIVGKFPRQWYKCVSGFKKHPLGM